MDKEVDIGIVRVPRWLIIVLLGLLLNGFIVVYSAGIVVNRVTELERRMIIVEQLLRR